MSCTLFAFLANVYHDQISDRLEAVQDVPPWKRQRRVYRDMGISADSHRSLYDSTDNTFAVARDWLLRDINETACVLCICWMHRESYTHVAPMHAHAAEVEVDARCSHENCYMSYSIPLSGPNWPWTVRTMRDCKAQRAPRSDFSYR